MNEKYESSIRTVENYPSPGIRFYDMSPLLGNAALFSDVIMDMAEPLRGKVDKVIGFDARGFIFAGALATELEVGCAMLRKPGKLPGDVYEVSYDLDSLALQTDAVRPNERVLLIDDVIATGGTALAGIKLVRKCGGKVTEFCALIDLPDLGGSRRIKEAGVPVRSFLSFGEHHGEM